MDADRRIPPRRALNGGFTLIEVIVAGAILVIVLGIVAVFFGQQTQMSHRTQARNDTQDRARLVMQLVTQDLSLAGATDYIASAGNTVPSASLVTCPTDPNTGISSCLTLTNSATQDALSVTYVNSLQPPSEACRTIDYQFSGDTLERKDTPLNCNDLTAQASSSFVPLANGILALDITLNCSSASTATSTIDSYPDQVNCPQATAYPRSATVTIVAESTVPLGGTPSQSIATASGQAVTCPGDRFCYGITQQVLLPNLKQN